MTMFPDRIYFADEPAAIIGLKPGQKRQDVINRALRPKKPRRSSSMARPARRKVTLGARRFWHTGCGASWRIPLDVHDGYVETKPVRDCDGCGQTLPVEPKPW